MKILVDIRMIENSGIGVYIQQCFSSIVNKYSNKKFDFYFITAEDFDFNKYNWVKKENTIISKSRIYSIKENLELPRIIPKGIDLLLVPHINIPIFYRGKMIITIHDVFHMAHYDQLSLLQKIYIKIISYFLKRKPTKILTVSKFSKQEIIRFLGVDKQKIHVTPNGVDEQWRCLETSTNINDGKPYFVYIGNIKPHKNLSNLIIAFKSIKEKLSHDLIIIGKKDGFITGDNNIMELANSMKGRVKFTGFIENNELRQYLNQADAMIFPSYYEGFGLPPLEAMACGTPVIASNAASIPEVCGDAALYFNPYHPEDIAEKILTFISDEQLQNDLREKGLKRSKLFSWEKCAEQTIKVIEEVLAD